MCSSDLGRLNVEITAQKIEKITGIKPVIYLDNITALTIMQEKEGADWIELMHWLSKLRNKGYHVTFLHHPTKEGATASGSNIKERSIDIDMKLTTPDEKESVEDYEDNHTQMTISFLKWREHMNTTHSKELYPLTTASLILSPTLYLSIIFALSSFLLEETICLLRHIAPPVLIFLLFYKRWPYSFPLSCYQLFVQVIFLLLIDSIFYVESS